MNGNEFVYDVLNKVVKTLFENGCERIRAYASLHLPKPGFRIDVDEGNGYYKDKLNVVLQNEFITDNIVDVDTSDDYRNGSFKGKNEVKKDRADMRIIITNEDIEIGEYTGELYDYEVLKKKEGTK
jgi:hypothetical protein